jgi:ribose-phosphate pyrophosphokinase
VGGRVAIIIDDLISSGTTLVRAAEACRARGATAVYAAASHGVFVAKAAETLSNPALEQIVVTNTIPPFRLAADLIQKKLAVLDASQLFAEAIRRTHSGGSIVELLET